VIRGNLQAALENVALWHERDISHSSVERVILPDSTITLDYMLHVFAGVMDGLRVFPDRMRANIEATGGVVFSQAVLLALINRGLSREDAYRIVQDAAAAAWDRGADFRAELLADPQAVDLIRPDELDAVLDPLPHVANLGGVFDRLSKLPGELEGESPP
jgi:adenylosuccinate lyase